MSGSKKQDIWRALRKLLGARLELPASDVRGGVNQLPQSAWDEVQYDEQTHEREQRDDDH